METFGAIVAFPNETAEMVVPPNDCCVIVASPGYSVRSNKLDDSDDADDDDADDADE